MKRSCCFLILLLLFSGHPALGQAAPQRVVALLGSYGEAWLEAGGSLVGATKDAFTERQLNLDDSVFLVGDNKNPSLEIVLSLEPDLVLYSTELDGQNAMAAQLDIMGVPTAGFQVDTYGQYMDMMEAMCALTGRQDLFQRQIEKVEKPIEEMIALAGQQPGYGQRTALLLRAFSSGVKAKDSQNLAGHMLRDMGLVNIADGSSLMENLTLEAILAADPDYIFVTVMGSNEEEAMAYLSHTLMDNPAWQGLSAVEKGRVIHLEKELYHLKPNGRWARAYEQLYELLYEA